MSRRDSRDSETKRHRSRFDREPSPKRSRRDEKDEKETVADKVNSVSAKQTDQDQKHHRTRPPVAQDTVPLESPLAPDSTKVENGESRKESDEKKASGHLEGTKNSTDHPTQVPRSRSSFEHNERGSAGQVVRSSRRGSTTERGSWRDSKDRHDDRTVSKTTNDSRPRNEKPKGDGNRTWCHDGFSEMEADPPPTRKRPSFREKKIPLESENGDKATVETAKSSHADRYVEGSRKMEERGDNARHLNRYEKPSVGQRFPYRGEAQSGVFPSRERYTGGAAHNQRGRDRLNGRQGSHSSGGRGEKWKHDLYHEANRSPTPKNEEEQIAKEEEPSPLKLVTLTVSEIKEKVEKYQGIPVPNQTLVFKGQVLDDEHDVAYCELLHNSHIQLSLASEYDKSTNNNNDEIEVEDSPPSKNNNSNVIEMIGVEDSPPSKNNSDNVFEVEDSSPSKKIKLMNDPRVQKLMSR